MPRPGRNDHGEIPLDAIVDPVDPHDAAAFFKTEELVAILVHFLADVAACRQGHQHQLQVMAGIENAPEIVVSDGQLLNIVAISLGHQSSLVGSWPQFIRLYRHRDV